jgi:hypothetical protein
MAAIICPAWTTLVMTSFQQQEQEVNETDKSIIAAGCLVAGLATVAFIGLMFVNNQSSITLPSQSTYSSSTQPTYCDALGVLLDDLDSNMKINAFGQVKCSPDSRLSLRSVFLLSQLQPQHIANLRNIPAVEAHCTV